MVDADLLALREENAPGEFDYWSRDKVANSYYADSSRSYILESPEGKVIGHAVFQCVLDEASLLNIGITIEYRRLGYGRQLLLSSLQDLANEGTRRSLLEVRCSNHSAIALYEKLGFSKDGVRKNYYPSESGSEDALLMSINIEGDLV